MKARRRKAKKPKAPTEEQVRKAQRATWEKYALRELSDAVKGLDPAYIEALAIVGSQLKAAKLPVRSPGESALHGFQNAVRHVVLALGGVDPVTREISIRLTAELEAMGASETKH